MLVPPTSSGLLGSTLLSFFVIFSNSDPLECTSSDLDPTKIKKGRTFNKGSSAPVDTAKDMSLWTETPAERQQHLADKVSGKKRRVTHTIADNEDEGEKLKKKRRKEEEESIRKGVEEHTVRIDLSFLLESDLTTASISY